MARPMALIQSSFSLSVSAMKYIVSMLVDTCARMDADRACQVPGGEGPRRSCQGRKTGSRWCGEV